MRVNMKSNLVISSLLLILMILAATVSAQQLYIGAIGGVNFADLNLEDDRGEKQDISTRNGFGFGGVLEMHLGQNFYLQLEPMYLQKGGVLHQEPPNPEEIEFKMSFVEIPLFLKIQFGEQIRPYIMGGPTVGFLLSSKLESEISGLLFKADLEDITGKVDFGVGVGAGVSVPLDNSNIFLDGRYTLGLTNLNKGGTYQARAGDIVVEGEIQEEVDASSGGFQIMVGVAFPIGG